MSVREDLGAVGDDAAKVGGAGDGGEEQCVGSFFGTHLSSWVSTTTSL